MKTKRILWALAACAAALLIALTFYPIRNTGIKALMLLCSGTCGIALIAFVPKRIGKIAVATILAAPILIVAFGPLRPTEPASLRSSYVESLRSYTNIAYVWGGENRRGVDCSGLIRAAWMNTHFSLGLRQLNPGLIREALLNWWFDASAKEMGNGYGNRTRKILDAPTVRAIDLRQLQPGDLAVVSQGVHIMAYLGDGQWIEADPGVRRVIELNVKDKNPWLDARPVVVRWVKLSEAPR